MMPTYNRSKVAFCMISTHLGGAEKSLIDFLILLQEEHKQFFTVIVPKKNGPLIDLLTIYKIDYEVIPIHSLVLKLSRQKIFKSLILAIPSFFLTLLYIKKLRFFLKQEKITTIHSTGLKFHIISSLISLTTPVKVIIHVRDIINSKILVNFFWITKKFAKLHFLANSELTASYINKLNPQVVYNGFNSERFYPLKNQDLKRRLDLNENTLIIGTVGVIARWKGQREFLKMAANLSKIYDHLYFVIVGSEIYDTIGDKGEKDTLVKMTVDLELENKVSFIEFQDEIEKIYNSLDIFVHCSIQEEPFGRVVVEAMLCGLPVVAASPGGPDEIISNGVNGLLYPMGSVSEMTQTVEELINSRELRFELSRNAQLSQDNFSLKSYKNNLSLALFA